MSETTAPDWAGDHPFFLMFEPTDGEGGNVGIDLDEGGWIERNRETLRRPGTWFLMSKLFGSPQLAVRVHEGEQPYYVARHIGDLMAGRELIAYGLGKKCLDKTMVRLWLLPNGLVCGGDDVDDIAPRMI